MEKKTPFRELSMKAKVQYIWDYYRLPIVCGICLIAFVISMISHYVTSKDSVLDIMMVNVIDTSIETELSTNEFFEQKGFSSKKEEILIDTSIFFTDDPSNDYYSSQSFNVKLAAGGIDVLFAPQTVFEQYAATGGMLPLKDYLTEEEIAQYADTDCLIYGVDPETEETVACGILLKESAWLLQYPYYNSDICLGISCTTDAKETSVDFFHYVTGN